MRKIVTLLCSFCLLLFVTSSTYAGIPVGQAATLGKISAKLTQPISKAAVSQESKDATRKNFFKTEKAGFVQKIIAKRVMTHVINPNKTMIDDNLRKAAVALIVALVLGIFTFLSFIFTILASIALIVCLYFLLRYLDVL